MKFELGPIQKAWITELKAHPERQMRNRLGYLNDDRELIQGCCLVQFLACYNHAKGLKNLTIRDSFFTSDSENISGDLKLRNFEDFGLYSEYGKLVIHAFDKYSSLSNMNDRGMTWTEIAEYIESNPENVFNKSI